MARLGRMVLKSSQTDDTSPEDGLLLGKALAMDRRRVAVARDLSRSSSMMADAVIAGLLFQGADVVDLGALSAPAAAMAAANAECTVYVAGRQGMISGYYLMNPDGSLFSDQQVRHLDLVFQKPPVPPDHAGLGEVSHRSGITEEYNERIIDLLRGDIKCPIIADCECGTASDSLPQILNSLGADVMTVNAQKDPGFLGDADRATSTDKLREMVLNSPGSIGIRVNGIGTLAEVVDEKGVMLPMEKVFALVVMYMRPRSVAVTVSAPSLIEDVFLHGAGADVETSFDRPPEDSKRLVRTEDSAAAVCEAVAGGVDLGYYHGSIVFGGGAALGDGIRAAAVIGQMAGDNSLHTVSESLPVYLRDTRRYGCDLSIDIFAREMEKAIKDLKDRTVRYGDVYRTDMESGWFAVRHQSVPGEGSSIDVVAESDDRAYLAGLMEMADDVVRSVLKAQRSTIGRSTGSP